MPLLPSGFKLEISRDALFDHGGNWFECPDGEFWYWAPDAQIMRPAPYELGSEIIRSSPGTRGRNSKRGNHYGNRPARRGNTVTG